MAAEQQRQQEVVVARIVQALLELEDGGDRARECARALEEPFVAEAAAQAVKALREGPPVVTEKAAVRAYAAHLLGRAPRRLVVYTLL